jgi:prepilin-type N-terminal cleavage/methylation domain-containing protein
MRQRIHILPLSGFSLIELLLVVAVMGLCLAAASVLLGSGLSNQDAREAARCWQAGATSAQVAVLWQGGTATVRYGSDGLAISHDLRSAGGNLGSAVPTAPVSTNVARWRDGDRVAVDFGGSLGSPDGGGSLYFHASGTAYRVVVRPESGLTTRDWVEE